MNTDATFSPDELEVHEVRILAVLLGEASAAETAAVESLVTSYPQLKTLRARLSLTIGLLRDTARVRTNEKAPAQLSPERREALLAVLSGKTAAVSPVISTPATSTVSDKSAGVSPGGLPAPVKPRKSVSFRQVLLHPYVGWAGLAACLVLGFAGLQVFKADQIFSSAQSDTATFSAEREKMVQLHDRLLTSGKLAEAPPVPESKPGSTAWFDITSGTDGKKTWDSDGDGRVVAEARNPQGTTGKAYKYDVLTTNGDTTKAPANRADTNLALSGGGTSNGGMGRGTAVTAGMVRFAVPSEDFVSPLPAADAGLVAPGASPFVTLEKSPPVATTSPAMPREETESLASVSRSRSMNVPLAPATPAPLPPPPAAKPASATAWLAAPPKVSAPANKLEIADTDRPVGAPNKPGSTNDYSNAEKNAEKGQAHISDLKTSPGQPADGFALGGRGPESGRFADGLDDGPRSAPAPVTVSGVTSSLGALADTSGFSNGRQSATGTVSLGLEGGKDHYFREADAKAKNAPGAAQPAEPSGPTAGSGGLAFFGSDRDGPQSATGKREEATRKPSEMTADPFSAPAPAQEITTYRGAAYTGAVPVAPGQKAAGAYGFTTNGVANLELRDAEKEQSSLGRITTAKDAMERSVNEGLVVQNLSGDVSESASSLEGRASNERRSAGDKVSKLGEERSKLRGLDEVAQVDGVEELRKNMQEQKELKSEFKKELAGEVPVLGDLPALGQLFAREKGNKALEDAAKSKKDVPDPFATPAPDEGGAAFAPPRGGDGSIGTRRDRTKGNSLSFLDAQPELRDKLENIKIDDVNFRGLPLSRVVETLSALSAKGDTSTGKGRRGVEINLFDPMGADPTVTITLKDTSLGKTLEYVAEQVGMKMEIVDGRFGLVVDERVWNPDKPALNPADISRPLATLDNAFSTFALNVSDASFRLTRDALSQGTWDATKIRSEEFYNAFQYRDPAPQTPIGLTQETSTHPFTPGQMLVRLGVQTQAQGRAPQQPLHLTVLLDNSGSMERADRREAALAALRGLAQNLGPQDTISLVSFSATPRLWLDHIPGNQAAQVAETAAQFPAEGGTNLEAALQAGYDQAEKTLTPGAQNAVILLTDGSANLGNADANSLSDLVTSNRQRGIAFHAYGVGRSDLNDATLERLARNGDGRYAVLGTPEEAEAQMVGPLAGSFRPAALDVKVQVEWNSRRVKAHRLVGFAERRLTKEQFRDNTVDGGELAAAASGNALYSVETIPDGDGPLGTVRVRYRDPATNAYRELSWPVAYDSGAASFGEAPRGLRLAGVAALLAERLQGQPAAQDTVLADLRKIADQLAGEDTGDTAVPALAEMVRQAETLLNSR